MKPISLAFLWALLPSLVLGAVLFSNTASAANNPDDELMQELEKDAAKEKGKPPAVKKELATVDQKELAESRDAIFGKRPRPPDLEFNRDKMKAHVLSLPNEYKKVELERYNRLRNLRDYLLRLLERTPYDSPDGVSFVSKSGNVTKRKGTVALANERYLILRPPSGNAKGKKIEWDDLPIEQYEKFFEYFAARRAAVSAAPGMTKEQISKSAAEDYLTAAVIADWYGRYEKAIDYGKKALALCPEMKPDIERLLLE